MVKIAMLGELVEGQLENPDGARAQVQKLTDTARQVVREMDEVVWTINPKNDTIENFASYLSHTAREHFGDTGIQCHIDMPAAFPDRAITAEMRHHLFMAVKEALNNIVKHAHASDVWVRLQLDGGDLEITVRDNGQGCSSPESRGSGRANMPERLAQIGGRLDFASQPGKGTTIIMKAPLG
jgi:signal transduction histidine kinase